MLRAFLACLFLFVGVIRIGAQEDDDEQPPGLRGRYQVKQAVVERVDPDIEFQWGENAPDERLPSGSFTANWTGSLLLRSADRFQFHAFVQGKVLLKLNGQTVLEGNAATPQWISGPVMPLTFGEQPFDLSFAKSAEAAQLKLYWSSNEFPLEPVPYHALFQPQAAPDLNAVERGRIQFDAFRCASCHVDSQQAESSLPAPSLKHVDTGTRHAWLVEKLMAGNDAPAPANSRMPHFGFDRSDAEAIVATLLSRSAPAELKPAPKGKDSERAKDLAAGQTLVRSLGCLACHTWNSLGEATPYGGGSLDELSTRRSADWLNTWLTDPARLNPRHRMPVFGLSDKERAQIVLALSSPSKLITSEKPLAADAQTLARGVRLIEASRCGQCHELPGTGLKSQPVVSLASIKPNWNRSCLHSSDRTSGRPVFPQVASKEIQAFVASLQSGGGLTPSISSTTTLSGRRLLERKNCLGCHDRDDVRGISRHAAAVARADESLAGLHMTLIPPRLNAVGDRMHDAGLAEAIRGEQKSPRLNWLRVRMPKFAHSPGDQALLLKFLVGHDRIPDGGPKSGMVPSGDDLASHPQQIVTGRELLGGKGFSCVACHAVKDYTPKVTALGTRGSNLHLIGQRMRTEYFFRWTRAPLRVMPGVEMPNYQRAHEFILPGQLDQQLIAIWVALNDPNLTAPTNPSVVEQLFAIGDQDLPKVVRDVFTVPAVPEETVARAYAFGLPGGHSVLFDLDTCSVRGWTLGDFARQRCEGKRWYWDLAGTVLASGFDKRPEILLIERNSRTIIAPETGWTVESRLNSEMRTDRMVSLDYDLTYSKDDVTHRLKNVVERFRPTDDGWKRQITVQPDDGLEPWYRNATPETVFDHSRIQVSNFAEGRDSRLPDRAVLMATDSTTNHRSVVINYSTTLKWQPPHLNPATPAISPPDVITSVPGFVGRRLPLTRSIMPTAFAWDHHQRLLFTSLKGHLYQVEPAHNGQTESLVTLEEGLAAPYGVIELPPANDGKTHRIVVAHKPELLELGVDDRSQVLSRKVLATGWGVTDDYHDWACGIARDSTGNLFVGLGSDYTFKNRPINKSRWRGDILRISPAGKLDSIARGLRYPTGLAVDDQDRLFCTDQQGVQNTFNELDYIQVGHRYGVPSRHESEPNAPADLPAIQIPHPWTRSVNGIVWIPESHAPLAPIAGQFLGCEHNNHMLIRMSLQTVGDVVQGAVYPFSRLVAPGDPSNFLGPLCIGLSPAGELFVGGLQDGGWAGGLNLGDIITLVPDGKLPNGIREIRATRQGFDLEFFHQVDPTLAAQTGQYKISGYTRVWKGDYATPDSGHHTGEVTAVAINADGRTISLTVNGRKTGFVYDISVGDIGTTAQRTLWPTLGHFTLHRIPD
ncbi:MAG: hypothetical protein JSS49_23595 [Planctomycetes bacterium]|nr:hypothetical protein [Planctomycetota bacterium]